MTLTPPPAPWPDGRAGDAAPGSTGGADAGDHAPAAHPDGSPGQPRPSGRRHRSRLLLGLVGLVAVAAVIAGAVVAGDWLARTMEMDRLVSGIEDSEAAMVGAIEGVRVAIGEDGDTDERSAETDAELQRIAAAARTDIAAAGEDVAAVAIQPWHEDVVAAQDAYLDHSGAWQDFLAAASDDAAAWFVDFPAIETTWQAFGPLVEAAVPTPALRNLQDRVALILADGDGPDGGPTLAAAGAG